MLWNTYTEILMPLVVAMNRIWVLRNNRSYIGNQLISLGLTFASGSLALLSVWATAGNVTFLKTALHGHGMWFVALVGFISMKIFAIAASIAIFFLIYLLFPNRKVPPRAVLPACV